MEVKFELTISPENPIAPAVQTALDEFCEKLYEIKPGYLKLEEMVVELNFENHPTIILRKSLKEL